MRRRLVLAISGAVAAAVAIVGLGTLTLTRIDARARNEDDLVQRVTALAAVVAEVRPIRAATVAARLEPAIDADTVEVVALDVTPAGLTAADADQLRSGENVSGRDGDTAYAAAPLPTATGRPPTRALLATDSIDGGVGAAGGWFVVAGAATVLLGALTAVWVARTLAGPVAAAEAATRRIAEGDLAARVPEPAEIDDELGALVHSINTMAASLEQARNSERDFLLSVSHDLRTPLTSIGGWAEALTDGAAADPAAAGGTILVEAGRLDRLVRDLLDLARFRARAFTLAREPVDLRDVAIGTAEGLRPDLEDAGLTVSVDTPDHPVEVDGDPDRLAQIAANLIENAGRYALDRVHVIVEQDRTDTSHGGDATLAVVDDGPGIPSGERTTLFERLHTGSRPAARRGSGSGLGLAITRELARAMGGDVAATDVDTGGARFVVRLPLRAAPGASATSTREVGHD
jgi:two-component system, OmpR family, sensor kinase